MKTQRFVRNWSDVPRLNAKAAILSGPPGIGKSSACKIVCAHLGYEVLEMNASDCRNKTGIQLGIGTLSENRSLDYWKTSRQNVSLKDKGADTGDKTQKSVIIMDEVDGCGAGDRGGIAQLISVIKNSKVPIICICNDRMNQKLQSLIGHCYDLKFIRPTPQAVLSRMRMVVKNEGLDVDDQTLSRLLESSGGCDMRQIINVL